MGSEGVDDRIPSQTWTEGHAAQWRECDNGARGGGWMAETGGQVWEEETERGFGGGDSNGAGRFSGAGVGRGVLGGGSELAAHGRRGDEPLFARRQAAESWRSVQESGPSGVVGADCGAWQGRVL